MFVKHLDKGVNCPMEYVGMCLIGGGQLKDDRILVFDSTPHQETSYTRNLRIMASDVYVYGVQSRVFKDKIAQQENTIC